MTTTKFSRSCLPETFIIHLPLTMTNQKFRTEIRISPGQFKIDHANTLLSIGSCFSEHIHERLKDAGFNSRCIFALFPSSIIRLSAATRTLKNSSILLENIPRNFMRSFSGTVSSAASCSTLLLNASQLMSLMIVFLFSKAVF